MKRALLLGGTGAMGVYLAPELLRRGYIVDITTRKGGKSGININYIIGDAKDTSFIGSILKKNSYDIVVDFMVYSTDEFRERVALLLKNTKHYIFLSTYRVFANQDKLITENSPRLLDVSDDEEYIKTDEYALAKARQEDILRASRYKNWTIVRPSITYSKERFQFGVLEADVFLARALNKKAVVFPEEMLDKRTTMTWAGDVAKMIAKLALNQDTMGEDYNVVTAENRTWREVLSYYGQKINIRLKTVPTDDFIGICPNKYQVIYDRMFDRVMDNSKILDATSIQQKDLLPLKNGLRKELTYYFKNPPTINGDNEFHQNMDTITDGIVLKAAKKLKPRTKLKAIRRRLRPRTRLIALKQKIRLRTRMKNGINRITANFTPGLPVGKRDASKKDGLIVTLSTIFNYGSVIQRYALREFLRKHNYKFDNAHFWDESDDIDQGVFSEIVNFTDRYIGEDIFDDERSQGYENYIVGSDQVWRNWSGEWDRFSPYFLEFLKADKKTNRISYAASFGVDNLEDANISQKDIKRIRPLLAKFDAISVREDSGTDLVKKILGGNQSVVNAKVVLDPVFLLRADDYSRLIDSSASKFTPVPKVYGYILDTSDHKVQIVMSIAKQYKSEYKIINPQFDRKYEPVEEWLKGFRDAKIVVTDSFHGLVLAIVNRKNFVVFGNRIRGSARFTNIFNLFGINSDRLIDEGQKIDISKLKPIDWIAVERRLDDLRKDSGGWLIDKLGGHNEEE